ncbi:Pumilio-like protein 12 [Dichanthelium oligosanthes]|uniref:Pumilio-like protein 12 n=1 Tax=Dichanthelium oligosanthes TaxID=888268 RepID=A0A1E5UKE4_9POAL|nr:Pumilio-like protein 12 [Dichanthelium oligosanthes]
MEESQGNQEASRFRAFSNGISGAAQESAGDRELHNVGMASRPAGAYLNSRRPFPSEFAMYDTSVAGSNQHFQGFSHSGSLYDEQSLASAFEDMTLNLKTHADDPPTSHRNVVGLTNGHYPSGHLDANLNQQHVPATRQDDSLPLHFSAAHGKQKFEVEHQEQGYGFPAHLGNFSRTPLRQSFNSNFGVPYHPSTASASPFQQQCYVDGQSQMYKPHDQNVSSNFIWPQMQPHYACPQPYSVMQPHYACPQMQQVSGFDVYQHRSNEQATVCAPARGSSRYIGTPNSHRLENGYRYFNGAASQKRNNPLNNRFTDSFPSTSYTDSSCGSGNFQHFQQAEKFFHPSRQSFPHHHQMDNLAHPYGLGFSHHQAPGRFNTASYPERILMNHDVGNSVRSFKFAPSGNSYADIGHRIGYGHDHLGIQLNNPLLQFSPSKSELTVDEVVGRICILAKDQNNCCFLQKILTEGTQEDADKVFYEIIDHIFELMVDPVAHYLVQKILEINERRMRIICEIIKDPVELIKVCCNTHGTRVMQKVIDTINTKEALMVVTALSHGTIRLITDVNGNHVIARCLQTLLPEHKAFIIEAAGSCYLQLARDRHGCCVLQKCIEHSNEAQMNDLLREIASSALSLSEDQYGNYVIQFILGLEIEWATTRVLNELAGHFGNLSLQKCGSHVVEHCIKMVPRLMCDKIVNELMNDPKLPQIMIHEYGNFVVQTALEYSQGELHIAFVETIRPHIATLRSNMFGKRVLSKTYLKNKHYRFGF